MLHVLTPPRAVSMTDLWFDLAGVDHFWIEWRFEALKKYVTGLPACNEPVLEIGCGHGIFRQQLEEQLGYTVDGCDLNVTALEMAREGRGSLFVYDIHDRASDLIGKYSAVFLMDVIEHIDDDAAFLQSAAAHARPGGVVVINVPAGPWLYSRYDEEAGHVRRYTPHTLTALLRKVGLTPLGVGYWGLTLVPILVVRKLMLSVAGSGSVIKRGFEPPGAVAHSILKGLKRAELMLPRSPIVGSSLLAVARVRQQG